MLWNKKSKSSNDNKLTGSADCWQKISELSFAGFFSFFKSSLSYFALPCQFRATSFALPVACASLGIGGSKARFTLVNPSFNKYYHNRSIFATILFGKHYLTSSSLYRIQYRYSVSLFSTVFNTVCSIWVQYSSMQKYLMPISLLLPYDALPSPQTRKAKKHWRIEATNEELKLHYTLNYTVPKSEKENWSKNIKRMMNKLPFGLLYYVFIIVIIGCKLRTRRNNWCRSSS